MVAFRVKVVYEIYAIDDTEAGQIESKMIDQKTDVELATNIEKESGLTTTVEASGEAPQIEAISDNNDNTPGNNKSGNSNTGVIVIVAIGSTCVCLAFAFGFYYTRKRKTTINNNKMFQEFKNMAETAPVVEKGLNTAAVPIQIGHGTMNQKDGKKDRVVEMQDRSQSREAPPALPSRSHFTRPAAVSGSASSTPAVANVVSAKDSSGEVSYYSTIESKKKETKKSNTSVPKKRKNARSTSNSNKNNRHSNVPAQYKNHIRHGVLDTHFSVDALPENYISTAFGDGELLYERPFDGAKVIRLKWGLLYQIND